MIYDEDTDDEHDNNNNVSETGMCVNINALKEPSYPTRDCKPKYTIPDEFVVEDSSTGCLLKNKFIIICVCKLLNMF